MKIISTSKKNNITSVVVEYDSKKWQNLLTTTFNKLAKSLNIQGFRKGHVPAAVAKSKIPHSEVVRNAINPAVDECYKELNLSKDFDKSHIIVDALNVDIKKVDDNNIQIEFNFEDYPEVKTPAIADLKVPYTKPQVLDNEIEGELARFSKNDWMLSSKEDSIVAKGNMANIDFTGYLDDKPFPGGSAKGYDLEIGSNSFIPGFEDQIVGMKKGDVKDIILSFPTDYHEKSLAGKKTKFTVTLNDVKEIVKPEWNAEYVKKFNIPNVNTLEDFKKHISNQILEMKKLQSRDQVVPLISQELIAKTKLSYYPESLLKDEKQRIMADIQNKAKQAGKSTDEYVKMVGYKSLADFVKNVDESAKKNLALVMAIEKLIKDLKIEITEADLNEYFNKLSRYYGTPADKLKEQFANRIEGLKVYLAQQKLFDKIIAEICK